MVVLRTRIKIIAREKTEEQSKDKGHFFEKLGSQ